MENPFWSLWYFQIPNYLLAALMYSLLGRLVLSAFVPAEWDNYIWKAFCRLTNPVIGLVRVLTPAIVPLLGVMLAAILWLMLARLGLFALFLALGLGPDPVLPSTIPPAETLPPSPPPSPSGRP